MAWIDDRIWCHPKIVDLSDKAHRVWIDAIAYAAGFQTRGHLTPGQQKLIGATPRIRNELLDSGLWEKNGSSGVVIHDWDDHNSKRDERRAKDRERKRILRQEGGK